MGAWVDFEVMFDADVMFHSLPAGSPQALVDSGKADRLLGAAAHGKLDGIDESLRHILA